MCTSQEVRRPPMPFRLQCHHQTDRLEMAAGPIQSCNGLCELRFFLSLVVLCGFLVSDSVTVKVTQEPLFASNSQGKNLTLHCSIDSSSYSFFWYHQLPGEVELQAIASLYTHSSELEDVSSTWKERVTGKWENPAKKRMSLHLGDLHPNDKGLYLCAARDTVSEAGSGVGAKPRARKRHLTAAYVCSAEKIGL